MMTTDSFQILILEEHTPITELVKRYLLRKGHKVECLKISAKEAHQLHLRKRPTTAYQSHISLFDGSVYHTVPIKDIIYIRVDHVYVEVFMIDGQKIVQRGSLKELLKQLPSDQFIQTHRSFAVNFGKIDGWNKIHLQIEGHEVPVSRARRKTIDQLLQDRVEGSFVQSFSNSLLPKSL